MFFGIFRFFLAYFLKVFGHDFSWSVHKTQYTTLRITVFCSVHTSGTKSWPKTCSKYAKKAKNAIKRCVFNVKMRKIKNGYAKKCEKIVNYTSGKILAENF